MQTKLRTYSITPNNNISFPIGTILAVEKLYDALHFSPVFSKYKKKGLDVLIATPPCQGMSVANHKKNDELGRNSLIIESIKMTKELNPKFFIYENVRAFLNTTCTDVDKKEKNIRTIFKRHW